MTLPEVDPNPVEPPADAKTGDQEMIVTVSETESEDQITHVVNVTQRVI